LRLKFAFKNVCTSWPPCKQGQKLLQNMAVYKNNTVVIQSVTLAWVLLSWSVKIWSG